MNLVAVLLSAASFFLLFRVLDLMGASRAALADGMGGFSALADKGLSDDEKEKVAQAASLRLLRQAGILIVLTALSLLPSVLILVGFVWAGFADADGLLALLQAWWFLALLVVAFAADIAWRRHAGR